jgi:hypothetical protein
VRQTIVPVLVVLGAALSIAGCKASVEANVNVGSKSDTVPDLDKPIDDSTRKLGDESSAGHDEAALLGARQDLTYKGPPTPTCKCLAVKVGDASDSAFQWAGQRPTIDKNGQLVIAMNSAGIACPEAGDASMGASYWGYEVSGNDVVVVVERAAPGRPVASGAIIPRPTGGQVYVRAADKKVPYGRPMSGAGDRCQVGNLPAVKTAAPQTIPSAGVRIKTDEPEPLSPAGAGAP